LLHAALADALKAELKARLLDAYEQERVFESVKTNYGEAYTSQTQPRGRVTDEMAFHDFLEQNTALTIRREVREVSGSGVELFLTELTPVVWQAEQECDHPEGDCDEGSWREATEEELAEADRLFEVKDKLGRVVPGVVWFTGGTVHNVTVKGDGTAGARLRRVAKQYATGAYQAGDLPL
jgi:hypothetical protein